MTTIVKSIRNNWKKSTLGAVAVIYGINFSKERYKFEQLMRSYCEEAAKYGDLPAPPTLKPKTISVILNPAANKRKAKSNFEKYSAPLLHLAGYAVSIHQTENDSHARTLAAELIDTDVIVVAGGDGTLSELVTGLMRGHGKVASPVGVVPLGRTNTMANALLGRQREGVATPADIAEATMAVVRGETKALDAVKVEIVEDQQEVHKPVYSMSSIKWGVYRDLLSHQDRYWYLGVFRGYAAVLFKSIGMRDPVTAHIAYTHACDGCSRCYKKRTDLQEPQQYSRWYHYILPSFTKKPVAQNVKIDYKQVINPNCGLVSEAELSGMELNISTRSIYPETSGVQVALEPEYLSWTEFLKEGWRRVKGLRPTHVKHIQAQELQLLPALNPQAKEDKWFSIDNEEFEVRPIKITLIPKLVRVFLPKQKETSYTLLERSLLGCC